MAVELGQGPPPLLLAPGRAAVELGDARQGERRWRGRRRRRLEARVRRSAALELDLPPVDLLHASPSAAAGRRDLGWLLRHRGRGDEVAVLALEALRGGALGVPPYEDEQQDDEDDDEEQAEEDADDDAGDGAAGEAAVRGGAAAEGHRGVARAAAARGSRGGEICGARRRVSLLV